MFEQIKTKHPTILSNPCVTFYKSIHPNNQEIIKEIVQQHKCLLSLSDNKAKLANIKAKLCYSITISRPIKSNMKIADLSDLLLQHCNTTTTVPITFVSDCSIDNYTEASKRDNFSQHETVTFINDSNMNTLQVQTGEDISETINLKRRNLTPVKQGYTPERHPTKKQKSKPRETETTSWIDENLHEPMSEPRFIFLHPWLMPWMKKASSLLAKVMMMILSMNNPCISKNCILYSWKNQLKMKSNLCRGNSSCLIHLTFPMIFKWLKQESCESKRSLTDP